MKEVYKGLFTRIRQAYPLDYYWLWTDENWTWSDADEKTVQGVVDDALIALAAAAWNQEPWGKSLSSIQEEGPVNGIYVSFPGKAVAGTKE
ncbi:MAG: hypothetical protein WAU81_14800 [Candidatus Aminicenantales bacterium]